MDGDSPVVMGKVVGHSPVVADDSAKLPSRSHGLGLFRPESLTDRPERWLGEVSLAVPVTFTVYAVCALATIAALVVFLSLGSYTTSESAQAIIVPDAGVVRVNAPVAGTVEQILVEETSGILAGTPLVRIRPSMAGKGGAVAESRIVSSPVAGWIYRVERPVQDSVAENDALLLIAQRGDLGVVTMISGKGRSFVEPGARVGIKINGTVGSRSRQLSGVVKSVAMAPTETVDPVTMRQVYGYRVMVIIDGKSHSMSARDLLGQMVTVKFPLQKRRMYQWLLDPMQALFE